MRKKILLFITMAACILAAGCGKKEMAWEKHITEEEIELEGIVGDYTLLFLTDMHVVVMDELDAVEIMNYANTRFRDFQNQEGVSAYEQWKDFITYANEKQVDGVLLGGDIIDYPSTANINSLDAELEKLTMPYLYTIGNHDWTYPWDYMTDSGREQHLTQLYPYMKGDTAIQKLDFGDFYVVAIDDCKNQVEETILAEYEAILKEGKPVIVLTHVPFWTDSVLTKAKEVWSSSVVIGGGDLGGFYPNDASKKFIELTTAKDSPVKLVLAGHVHFYDKDYIKGEQNILQIVGDAGFHGGAVLLHIKGCK